MLPEVQIPTPQAFPTIIARGPDGNMWLTELGADRIARIDASARTLTEFPPLARNSQPLTIAPGPDKAMWFTERGANRLGRITMDGAISHVTLPKRAFDPVGVTAGPDGNIWYTGFKSEVIGWLPPSSAR